MFNARVPVSHDAVRKLQALIRSGNLRPGKLLPGQRELSRQLRLSRASLREALSIMETLGLIRIEAGRGAFVVEKRRVERAGRWRFSNVFPEEEVFVSRLLIEPAVARAAATLASAAQIRQLGDVMKAMHLALRADELVEIARRDNEFHELVFRASNNGVMERLYESMAHLFEESQRRPFSRQKDPTATVREHQAIYRAIKDRAPQAAYGAMRRHIVGAARRLGIELPKV